MKGRTLSLVALSGLLLVGCDAADVSTAPAEPMANEAAITPVPVSPAVTSAASCDGTLGAVSVDEVHVPAGATCTLMGTQINSNVEIGSDGALIATGVQVGGDVEADGARAVEIANGSTISGSLLLRDGWSGSVIGSTIGGDIDWQGQTGPLRAEHNVIGGSLWAAFNTGGVTVLGNRIDKDLQCVANRPVPSGATNMVAGNHQDQCKGLLSPQM
jgi:hypothetical protein